MHAFVWLRKKFTAIIYRCFYAFYAQKNVCIAYGAASHFYTNLNAVEDLLKGVFPITYLSPGDSVISSLRKIAGAKVILIDQSNRYLSGITLGRKTACIQCWHAGGAFKKVGFDAKRKGFDDGLEEKRISSIHKNISYFVCSSEHVADVYAKAFRIPREKMLVFGLPRLDRCLNDMPQQADVDKPVILYAPTFRQGKPKERRLPDFPDVEYLRSHIKLPEGVRPVFAFRAHPSLSLGDINVQGWENWTVMDQKDALSKASILITDYSSIFFDFLIYKRPVVFYIPDKDQYKEEERNLYFEPEEFFKDTVCYSLDALAATISSSLYCTPDYSAFWKKEMDACDGHSSQRLFQFIKKMMEVNKQ